jgi:hypothetical protein
VGAVVVLGLLLAACGGGDEGSAPGDRTFEVADIVVREDGGILLAGTATRGDWDSEEDDFCDGDGPATRDLAVIEVSAAGRLEDVHSLSEDELDGCAAEVERAMLDSDELVVEAVVRESPGLIPGEGGPETREHKYAARFDPESDDLDGEEAADDAPHRTALARLKLPNGDWVVVEEDPARQRRPPDRPYSDVISLRRWSDDSLLWSRPVHAISPDVDAHEIGLEGGPGWALFVDPHRGIYGFAHYSTWSSNEEVVLFRHRLDGHPDFAFGDDSRLFVEEPWFHGTKRAVRLSDGDFVVAGHAGRKEPGRVVVRRFSGDGEPRPAFDRAAAGTVACRPPLGLTTRRDRVVVACTRADGALVVLRLGANGRLDPSFGRGGRLVVRRV